MHKIVSTFILTLVHFQIFALLYSRVGAGAMHKIVSTFVLTLVHFQIFALLYSRVGAGAGAAGATSKFLPGAGSGAA
jgi:hypothetical protein